MFTPTRQARSSSCKEPDVKFRSPLLSIHCRSMLPYNHPSFFLFTRNSQQIQPRPNILKHNSNRTWQISESTRSRVPNTKMQRYSDSDREGSSSSTSNRKPEIKRQRNHRVKTDVITKMRSMGAVGVTNLGLGKEIRSEDSPTSSRERSEETTPKADARWKKRNARWLKVIDGWLSIYLNFKWFCCVVGLTM